MMWKPNCGLDEIAHGARRQAERGLVERTDHLPLLEEAKVAAVGRAARVLRVLLRQRGEVLAGLDVLQHLLRPWRLPAPWSRRRRSARNADQDVARAHAFGLLELVGVLVVEVGELLGLDRHLRRDLSVDQLLDGDVLLRVGAQLVECHVARRERLLERRPRSGTGLNLVDARTRLPRRSHRAFRALVSCTSSLKPTTWSSTSRKT